MLLSESIRLAWEGLKANKMRALLTMLGIIIGIASVIGILTVGDGLSSSVTDSMSSLGASNISVSLSEKPDENDEDDTPRGTLLSTVGAAAGLFQSDINDEDKITDEMISGLNEKFSKEISGISLSENIGSGKSVIGKKYANISVTGANSDYLSLNEINIIKGRGIQDKDLNHKKNLAVVSDLFVENLFNGDMDTALNQEIQISVENETYIFRIIGVYEYEGLEPVVDNEQTRNMVSATKNTETDFYIPVSTAKKLNKSGNGYSSFTISVNAAVDRAEFTDNVSTFLNRYYTNSDYEVTATSMDSVLSVLDNITSTISIALSLIAGISLLVGGIGVMNIMLVSVTERTKEIGTRKALGATNTNIKTQFVVESIIVCLIGGVIGIILGGILGCIGTSYMGFFSLPSISSIALAVGFSLAIGIFFGYYPANKAAKLDPIEALRYE